MKTPIRVLIIEDSEDDKELLLRELRCGGYNPEYECVETREALNKELDKQSWDIILSDYTMPKFDGLTALKMVKARGLDIPFILISGTIGEEVAVEAMKSGAHDYLMKGKLARLVPTIERELKEAGIRRQAIIAEEELRQSRRDLQEYFENDISADYVVSAEGEILNCNRTFLVMFGFKEKLPLEKFNITQLFKNPDDRKELIRQVKQNGKVENFLVEFIDQDGKTIHSILNSIGKFDESGELISSRGYIVDITELKKAEERYRSLFDEDLAGNFVSTVDGEMLLCNQAYTEIMGFESVDEMLKANAHTFYKNPDDRNEIIRRIKANKKLIQYEYPLIRKDGKEIFLVANILGEFDHTRKLIRLKGYVFDITERKQAEREIAMLAHALRSINQCVSITDLENKIIFVNKAFLETYGFNESELIGKNITIIRSSNNPPEVVNKILPDTLLGGWKGELMNKRKDGSEFTVALSTTIIKGKDGNHLGLIGVSADITERKEAEQKLMNALENAQESDRLKSAFLSTMSHELRTPLNAVIGFSNLMIDEEIPLDQITSFAQMIHNSGNNLLEIVEGILDLTMLESGESKTHPELFSLSSFMDDILKIAIDERQKANKPQLEIEYLQCNTDVPSQLYSDRQKITKVFVHLFRNALKFTSSGQIEFGYVLDPDEKYDQIKFFVKDTGIGIRENQKSIIFERFRQADDSHTRLYGGTGIGLTIAKHKVELLGGQIWADSTPGKGTTFYFTIPIDKPEQLAKTVPEQKDDKESQKSLSNQTVLIAEDEDLNFEYLNILLLRLNLKILHARDGLEAVNLCSVHPEINLVLMDIKMPNMNGFEATKIIKQTNPKLPVIAVTAYAMSGDREKFIAGGCDEYLEKPIKQEKLFTMIRKFMS